MTSFFSWQNMTTATFVIFRFVAMLLFPRARNTEYNDVLMIKLHTNRDEHVSCTFHSTDTFYCTCFSSRSGPKPGAGVKGTYFDTPNFVLDRADRTFGVFHSQNIHIFCPLYNVAVHFLRRLCSIGFFQRTVLTFVCFAVKIQKGSVICHLNEKFRW